jgi:hypothetical protein
VVDQVRLQELIGALNEGLGDVTPYKLAVADPSEIQPVDRNAHYMPKRVYDQLVANVSRDGNLSSLPFCWRRPDGSFVSLSGNHRVAAAADAGIPLILFLYTDTELSAPERVAIQLSHNAIVGKDNPTVLRELWTEIDDLGLKLYTGLDEDLIDAMEPAPIVPAGTEDLRFEELTILFLPSDIERITDVVQRLSVTDKARLAARFEDFDRFFDALLDFKEAAGILNTATAFLAMIDVIEAWLAEHNAAERDHEPQE